MKDSITKKQLRDFGLLIGFAFPIFIGWLLPVLTGHQFRSWTLWIGVPAFLLSVVAPRFLHYPYKLWMTLGFILGWINSRIILALVYLLLLQPIAYIMRITGYDPLRRKLKLHGSYKEIRQNKSFDLNRIF